MNKKAPNWLKPALNKRGGLNGLWVTPQRHYLHDPDRWLKGGGRVWGDKFAPWLQPIDRIPEWIRGIGAGTGTGIGLGGLDGE